MALHRKYVQLLALEPDVAVISECANDIASDASGFRPASSVWIGDNPRKGVGVFTFGAYKASPVGVHKIDLPYIAPVRISGPLSYNLLAVWAVHNKTQSFKGRVGPLLRAIKIYSSFLRDQATVVAGDFNNHIQWDKPRGRNNHSDCVRKLEDLGLRSAYHHARGLPQGQETEPTLYWRDRRSDGPTYHIDYCFVPQVWLASLSSVTVGDFGEWVGAGLSDHVPLIVDIAR